MILFHTWNPQTLSIVCRLLRVFRGDRDEFKKFTTFLNNEISVSISFVVLYVFSLVLRFFAYSDITYGRIYHCFLFSFVKNWVR